MGLLDEAIREHLELQRRRGADPGEIARAESAALAPVLEQERAGAPVEHEPDLPSDEQPAESQLADFSGSAQETAEIDMREVLDEEHPAGPPEQVPGQERLTFE